MSIALDYTSRIAPAALKAAGVSDVCRYLSWPHYWNGRTHTEVNPKIIQRQEYDELANSGVGVTLNWEYAAVDWMTGGTGAQTHAAEAVRQAEELGYPHGCAIIGSADWDMSHAQWLSSARAYAITWRDRISQAGYRPGVYGPWDVLSWCRDEVGIDVFWQAGMSTAWSGGRNRNPWPGAHIRQRGHKQVGGVDTDYNDILIPDWGQYRKQQQGGTVALKDDIDFRFMFNRIYAIAWLAKVLGGEEEGKDLTFVTVIREIQANAALAATRPVAELTDEQLDVVAAKLASLVPTAEQIAQAVWAEDLKRLGNG